MFFEYENLAEEFFYFLKKVANPSIAFPGIYVLTVDREVYILEGPRRFEIDISLHPMTVLYECDTAWEFQSFGWRVCRIPIQFPNLHFEGREYLISQIKRYFPAEALLKAGVKEAEITRNGQVIATYDPAGPKWKVL